MSFLDNLLKKAKDLIISPEERAQGKKPNLLERIPMRQIQRIEKVQDFFKPVPNKVRVRDFVREVPEAIKEVGKEIAQGTARTMDFAGRKILETAGFDQYKDIDEKKDDKITQTIFGGNKKRAGNLGEVAEIEVGLDPEKFPVIAPLVGGTLVGLDLLPGGLGKGPKASLKLFIKGMTDEIVTTLSKTTDPKIIEGIIRDTSKGIDDTTVKALTENLAKIDSEDGIKKWIKDIENKVVKPGADTPPPGGEPLLRIAEYENTDAVRGGTWYSDQKGIAEVDTFNKSFPGKKQSFKRSEKPKKPFVVNDVYDLAPGTESEEVKDAISSIASNEYFNVYDKLNDVYKNGSKEITPEVGTILKEYGISDLEIKELSKASDNLDFAIGDLITSKELRKQGYDSLIINNQKGTHTFVFKPEKEVAPSIENQATKFETYDEFIESINEPLSESMFGPTIGKNAEEIKKIVGTNTFHGTRQWKNIQDNGFRQNRYFNDGMYFSNEPKRVIDYRHRGGGTGDGEILSIDTKNFKLKEVDGNELRDINKSNTGAEELVESIKNQGYDGVTYDNGWETLIWNIDKLDDQKPRTLRQIFDKAKESITKEVAPAVPYKETGNLTTKILKELEGKTTVSKQYILDATNRGDVKQQERELIREVAERFEDGKIDVGEFAKAVKDELVPLKIKTSFNNQESINYRKAKENILNGKEVYGVDEINGEMAKSKRPLDVSELLDYNWWVIGDIDKGFIPSYEDVALPDNIRGNVKNYFENIYEGPVKTQAGDVHFKGNTNNYFGHTRIEDMADDTTRRVLEVQTDLYQKGGLENETGQFSVLKGNESARSIGPEELAKRMSDRKTEVGPLNQYGNPTSHFRMVREEVAKAVADGKETLLFPSGETAMKIEGLGNGKWYDDMGQILDEDYLEFINKGDQVNDVQNNSWIITDVLEDGKFKAIQEAQTPKITYDPKINKSKVEETSRTFFINGEYSLDRWLKVHGGEDMKETFDISGKIDKENPIFKFYEKTLAKYLKKNYKATDVVDDQGVSWKKLDLRGAKQGPTEAFGVVAGFEQDEDGNITIDPLKAGLGIVGAGLARNLNLDGVDPRKLIDRLKDIQNAKGFDEGVGNLWQTIDASEVSYAMRPLDDTGYSNAGYRFSTYPKWVPEELRSKKLMNKVLEQIQAGKQPANNASREKRLYDIFLREIETSVQSNSDEYVLNQLARDTEITPSQINGREINDLKAYDIETGDIKTQDDLIQARSELVENKELAKAPQKQKSISLPNDFYRKNIETKRPSIGSLLKGKVSDIYDATSRGLSRGLVPISTRLEQISPDLKTAIRRFEFLSGKKTINREKAILPLLKKSKEMKPEVKATFDLARKNGDAKKLQQLIIQNNMGKEYSAYRKVLNGIYKEAQKYGIDVGFLNHYAPRIIKDKKGFLEYLRRTDEWDIISEAINKRAKSLGKPVTDMTLDEKAQVANSMIRGYGNNISLARPGATKERAIDIIDKTINKFYEDSDTALVRYVNSMTDAIEAKKFFGAELNTKIGKQNLMKRLRKRINTRLSKIEKWKQQIQDINKNETGKRATNKITTRKRYINETRAENKILEKNISDAEKDVQSLSIDTDADDSIGAYIIKLMADGKIKPNQEKELSEILKARFNKNGAMNSALRSYKNLEYISTMGNPISAVTQIGDLGLAIYKNGLGRTIRSLGKKTIKREDVGIEKIAQEFGDGSLSGKAVDRIFKIVGLDKVDRFGKETLINGSFKKLKDTIDNPKVIEEVNRVYGNQSQQFISDVKAGKLSENVRFWLFNDLADMQPITMSEMPEAYLKNANGRIFYMLKSYTLKLLDIYRRDVFRKFKTEPVQALKNFVYLGGSLAIMNGTADEIKDFLLGRETSFSDRLTESILKSVGLNRWTTSQIGRDGIGDVILDQIRPPASAFNAVSKAVTSGDASKLTKQIPIFGKLLDAKLNTEKELTPQEKLREKLENRKNTTVGDILKRREKSLSRRLQNAGYSKRDAENIAERSFKR